MIIILTILLQSIPITSLTNSDSNVTYKYLFSLGVDNDAFYDSADIFYSESKYIVYDKGNSRLKIYDSKGKLSFEFGEEGNGPNQLSNAIITVLKDRIIAIKRSYISLFDFEGNLISTIKKDPTRKAFAVESKNGFYLYFKSYKKNEILFTEYSLDGIAIKSQNALTDIKLQKLDAPLEESMRRFIQNEYDTKSDFVYFNGQYFNYQNGEFRLNRYSSDLEEIASYNFSFNRIAIDEKAEKNYLYSKGRRDYALEEKVNKYRNEIYAGFLSDIVRINGSNSKYLFISLEAKSNSERKTLVLNKEMKIISEFTFYQKEMKSWKISAKRILAYFKNDEIRPLFKIYELIERD